MRKREKLEEPDTPLLTCSGSTGPRFAPVGLEVERDLLLATKLSPPPLRRKDED